MALTINNFWGAESGGMEEAAAFSNVIATSFDVKTGTYTYSIFSSAANVDFLPFESVADAGGKYIVKFDIRLESIGSNNHVTGFLQLTEGAAPFLELALHDTTDDLLIYDANGATIRTITQPFTADVYSELILVFEHSASGTVELFIDGVSQGEDIAQDLTDGGTFDTLTFRKTINQALFKVDNIVFQSGATNADDKLIGAEIFAYRSTVASVTADWIKGANGDLNSGTWVNAQEDPFSEANIALYSDATARAGGIDTNDDGGSAGTGGPNTDANIDGDSNIVAMKGIWRMKRGTGSGATHFGLLGNTGTAIADSDRTIDLTPLNSYVNYFDVREDNLPLSSEYGRIGFEKNSGGQDFDCSDMLFQVLHIPNVGGNVSLLSKFRRNMQHMMVR